MKAYHKDVINLIEKLDPQAFEGLIQLLLDAYHKDSQVFIMGNGGSAGTANHFVCDFGKNAVRGEKRRFRILSLCDNIEKITALANDISFDEIFRQQLVNLMRPGDMLIAVSASGNSPNLIRACQYCKEQGGKLAVLAGFQGGKIKEYADVALVVNSESYERIEDIHLMILHMAVCFIKERQELLES